MAIRGSTAINIRPDDETYGRIARLAAKERRSVANMTQWLLAEHPLLKAEPKLNGHHHEPKAPRATT